MGLAISEKEVKNHMLRHSFATTLLRSGKSPAIVQRLMCHRSFEVTNETYSHYILTDLSSVMNSLPVIRDGLSPLQVFENIAVAVKGTGIENDSRFTLEMQKCEEEIIIRAKVRNAK